MPYLMIAAYWITDDDAQSLSGVSRPNVLPPAIPGSGAVVTFKPRTVDRDFRRILRRIDIAEAAEWEHDEKQADAVQS